MFIFNFPALKILQLLTKTIYRSFAVCSVSPTTGHEIVLSFCGPTKLINVTCSTNL